MYNYIKFLRNTCKVKSILNKVSRYKHVAFVKRSPPQTQNSLRLQSPLDSKTTFPTHQLGYYFLFRETLGTLKKKYGVEVDKASWLSVTCNCD